MAAAKLKTTARPRIPALWAKEMCASARSTKRTAPASIDDDYPLRPFM